MAPLVFKTSVGSARVLGGFDSHSPPPFFPTQLRGFLTSTMKNPLSRLRFLSMRPARWSILGFRFVPLLLFGVGTCAILYGGFFHRLPVTETIEEEFTVVEPVEPEISMGMPPGMDPNMPFGPPGMGPGMFPGGIPPEDFQPQVRFVTRIKTIETTTNELEWDLNVLMTFGGIALNEKGELVRLATSTEGPAFCPT